MIVQKKLGNIANAVVNKSIDFVDFHWYESNKRINHKTSRGGEKIRLKFLDENPRFTQGDILAEQETVVYCVHILACDCLVIRPRSLHEMAASCYEIGNRHIPLFYQENELLMAFEKPIAKYFQAMNYDVSEERRQLLNPLNTTVLPHGESKSLFTRIMQLSNSGNE